MQWDHELQRKVKQGKGAKLCAAVRAILRRVAREPSRRNEGQAMQISEGKAFQTEGTATVKCLRQSVLGMLIEQWLEQRGKQDLVRR